MGIVQGKSKTSCKDSPDPCACTCINCSFFPKKNSNGYPSQCTNSQQLPDRTTAFSGNPFYSCQHDKPRMINMSDQKNRWYTRPSKIHLDRAVRNVELIKDENLNKGLAFTQRERELLGLRGLLPAGMRSQELQVKAIMMNVDNIESPIGKYMYLRDIQDYDKRLFYRVLRENTEKLMPIVYTPVVGEACQKYSLLYKRPRGLFISVHDAGHISSILNNWPEKDIKAIVVTDGERILGLGDLGANGMGIPVGKLALYSALAGIPPYMTLPVMIDVGTNNENLLSDPLYIGLKQKRVTGPQYDDLIDEFMEAVIKRWGRSCLIQFEDFGNHNAFRLLEKYKPNFCTFNDDIQGTAAVTVAGILASSKITGTKIGQNIFLFNGAGEAALGTADLLTMILVDEGYSREDALSKIFLTDSKGLITPDREEVDSHKRIYAKNLPHSKDLEEIIDMVKPTALFGLSAQSGIFTDKVLKRMAAITRRPLIFPLSNPTSKAECTAEEAYKYTDGRCIFASGSPFQPVHYKGQTFVPGQGNNAYIFPGVAMAAMACEVHSIPEQTFAVAARALADQVTKDHLMEGRLYPPLETIHDVSLNIAAKTAQYFYVESLATVRPEPEDKLLFMQGKQYDYSYDGSGVLGGLNGHRSSIANFGIFTS